MTALPARFEHTTADAEAVYRGFVTYYWLIVVVLVVGGLLWQRQLLLVAAMFAVVLVLWQRMIDRVPKRPWVLEVGPERIAVDRGDEVDAVERRHASAVTFVRRHARGGSHWELLVLGPRKKRLLREGIRDDHKPGIEAALEEHGWPR